MAGRSAKDDPLKNYAYRVEIEDFVRAGFSECSGLEAALETVDYREGGNNATGQKSPGQATFPDLTLKRGKLVGSSMGGDDDMENWFQLSFDMNAEGSSMEFRKTVDIVLYKKDATEGVRYRLFEAYCSNYKPINDLAGAGNDNVMEEITITYEGFEKV